MAPGRPVPPTGPWAVRWPPVIDADPYKGRNVVERGINPLKDFLALATRYGKRGQNFLARILVAAIVI